MMMNLMTILVKKVFISSKPTFVCLLCPPLCGPFSIQESAAGGLSYKAKKGTKPPFTVLCPVELPERFPPLWEVAPSVVGRCRPAFSERRPKPVLLPGSFCVPLRHRLSDLSQNKTTFLFPKQKIIANPLSMRICRYFVHFLNFFQNPKQDVKSYLKFSKMNFSNIAPFWL